jgi:hypothetical protein
MPSKLPYPCKLAEASYCTAPNTAGNGKIRRVHGARGKKNAATRRINKLQDKELLPTSLCNSLPLAQSRIPGMSSGTPNLCLA